MNIAQSERSSLCDLFVSVGPEAPTLCEGWNAHDLAAHLWLREMDPVAVPGYFVPPLAGITAKRTDELKAKYTFEELVEKLRRGPGFGSVFSLPGVDEAANSLEYFVHHEDVRRASADDDPRPLGDEIEDFFWKRLRLMARAQFRRAKVGVVLEREGSEPVETIRAMPGTACVTLIGLPSELTLYAFGRTGAARVRIVGEPETVEAFRATELGA